MDRYEICNNIAKNFGISDAEIKKSLLGFYNHLNKKQKPIDTEISIVLNEKMHELYQADPTDV